jgi:uncharacterized protein (DUF697 family)
VPKLPDVWRVLREVDLEAIRGDSERSFRAQLAAEDLADAESAAALLSGALGERHPWLATSGLAPLPAVPGGASARDVAVLVTRVPELGARLSILAAELQGQRVPVVTLVVGAAGPLAGVVRPGEAARAAVASLDAAAVPALAQALLSGAPVGLRLALARQLPPLRPAFVAALVEETARANALYALGTGVAETVPLLNVPLNLADIVVLTKNQLVMSYRIALAAGKRGRPRDVLGEVMGVIGGGFLFRQLARELVGLIPVAGVAPKVAVAYAGTWAIGRAVSVWAGGGVTPSAASIKRYYAEAVERGREVAVALAGQAKRTGGRLMRRGRGGA